LTFHGRRINEILIHKFLVYPSSYEIKDSCCNKNEWFYFIADAIILGEEHIQESRQKGHYTLEEHCVGGS